MPQPDRTTPDLFSSSAGAAEETTPVGLAADVVNLDSRVPLTVAVDSKMAGEIKPGTPVLIQGRSAGSVQSGWIWKISETPMMVSGGRVLRVDAQAPRLSPELIDLATWIARYDRTPLSTAIKLIQPPKWPIPKERVKRITQSDSPISGRPCVGAINERPSSWASSVAKQENVGLHPTYTLTPDQLQAVSQGKSLLNQKEFASLLVFGVTGSGKTEVYVHLAQECLRQGRSVLILVPEIAIATQAITRLSHRFEHCAIWHSGIATGQKARTWQKLMSGELQVVIGTRSAVLLPMANLGMIVVDEEQEASYKNLASPRYHARNVALMRGQRAGCLVLLASATPSLEALYNSKSRSEAHRVDLPHRATGVSLPKVEIVDRGSLPLENQDHLFTPPLIEELQKTMGADRQAILLLNRRGWAGQIQCGNCGYRMMCPSCSMSLVAHQGEAAGTVNALCHHCSHQEPVPRQCPRCSQPLQFGRYGVDFAVMQFKKLFPGYADRVLPFDADQVSKHADYERILSDFSARKFSVLLGTQMVAKGLDFSAVRLVAILDADQRLNMPDFRASERTAQLLVQVAGRAGRASEQGIVLIQTRQPTHPAIQAAVSGNYGEFAEAELVARKENHWPPYTRLARAVLQDPSLKRVWEAARKWRQACQEALHLHAPNLEILAPGTPHVPRRRNLYRLQVLWRCPGVGDLLRAMDLLAGFKLGRPKVHSFYWDMDPVTFE